LSRKNHIKGKIYFFSGPLGLFFHLCLHRLQGFHLPLLLLLPPGPLSATTCCGGKGPEADRALKFILIIFVDKKQVPILQNIGRSTFRLKLELLPQGANASSAMVATIYLSFLLKACSKPLQYRIKYPNLLPKPDAFNSITLAR
jgi:hypothetical protein